ncbi:MAG: hypothetical protein KDK65_01480 [Chlamydiia bacterium]|nr:hypothetical protein [Chlamydiia bacterium]
MTLLISNKESRHTYTFDGDPSQKNLTTLQEVFRTQTTFSGKEVALEGDLVKVDSQVVTKGDQNNPTIAKVVHLSTKLLPTHTASLRELHRRLFWMGPCSLPVIKQLWSTVLWPVALFWRLLSPRADDLEDLKALKDPHHRDGLLTTLKWYREAFTLPDDLKEHIDDAIDFGEAWKKDPSDANVERFADEILGSSLKLIPTGYWKEGQFYPTLLAFTNKGGKLTVSEMGYGEVSGEISRDFELTKDRTQLIQALKGILALSTETKAIPSMDLLEQGISIEFVRSLPNDRQAESRINEEERRLRQQAYHQRGQPAAPEKKDVKAPPPLIISVEEYRQRLWLSYGAKVIASNQERRTMTEASPWKVLHETLRLNFPNSPLGDKFSFTLGILQAQMHKVLHAMPDLSPEERKEWLLNLKDQADSLQKLWKHATGSDEDFGKVVDKLEPFKVFNKNLKLLNDKVNRLARDKIGNRQKALESTTSKEYQTQLPVDKLKRYGASKTTLTALKITPQQIEQAETLIKSFKERKVECEEQLTAFTETLNVLHEQKLTAEVLYLTERVLPHIPTAGTAFVNQIRDADQFSRSLQHLFKYTWEAKLRRWDVPLKGYERVHFFNAEALVYQLMAKKYEALAAGRDQLKQKLNGIELYSLYSYYECHYGNDRRESNASKYYKLLQECQQSGFSKEEALFLVYFHWKGKQLRSDFKTFQTATFSRQGFDPSSDQRLLTIGSHLPTNDSTYSFKEEINLWGIADLVYSGKPCPEDAREFDKLENTYEAEPLKHFSEQQSPFSSLNTDLTKLSLFRLSLSNPEDELTCWGVLKHLGLLSKFQRVSDGDFETVREMLLLKQKDLQTTLTSFARLDVVCGKHVAHSHNPFAKPGFGIADSKAFSPGQSLPIALGRVGMFNNTAPRLVAEKLFGTDHLGIVDKGYTFAATHKDNRSEKDHFNQTLNAESGENPIEEWHLRTIEVENESRTPADQSALEAIDLLLDQPSLLDDAPTCQRLFLVIFRPLHLLNLCYKHPDFLEQRLPLIERLIVQAKKQKEETPDHRRLFFLELLKASLKSHVEQLSTTTKEELEKLNHTTYSNPHFAPIPQTTNLDFIKKQLNNPDLPLDDKLDYATLLLYLYAKNPTSPNSLDADTIGKLLTAKHLLELSLGNSTLPQVAEVGIHWVKTTLLPWLKQSPNLNEALSKWMLHQEQLDYAPAEWASTDQQVWSNKECQLDLLNGTVRALAQTNASRMRCVLPHEILDNSDYRHIFGEQHFSAELELLEPGVYCYHFRDRSNNTYRVIKDTHQQEIFIERLLPHTLIQTKKDVWHRFSRPNQYVAPTSIFGTMETEMRNALAQLKETNEWGYGIEKELQRRGCWINTTDKRQALVMLSSNLEVPEPSEILNIHLNRTGKVTSITNRGGYTLIHDKEEKSLEKCFSPIPTDKILFFRTTFSSKVSRIQLPEMGLTLNRTSGGNYTVVSDEWRGYQLRLGGKGTPVEKWLKPFGVNTEQFSLTLQHPKSKQTALLLWPQQLLNENIHKKEKQERLAFEKMTTKPMVVKFDREGRLTGSAGAFLYLAYLYAAKRQPKEMLTFLELAKKSRLEPYEVPLLDALFDQMMALKGNSLSLMAMKLKGSLAISEIKHQQLDHPIYKSEAIRQEVNRSRAIGNLYAAYDQRRNHSLHRKEALSEWIALSPTDVKELTRVNREGLAFLTDPKMRKQHLTSLEKVLFVNWPESIDAPHNLLSYLIANTAKPHPDPKKLVKEGNLLSENRAVIHFFELWNQILTDKLTPQDLSSLFTPLPFSEELINDLKNGNGQNVAANGEKDLPLLYLEQARKILLALASLSDEDKSKFSTVEHKRYYVLSQSLPKSLLGMFAKSALCYSPLFRSHYEKENLAIYQVKRQLEKLIKMGKEPIQLTKLDQDKVETDLEAIVKRKKESISFEKIKGHLHLLGEPYTTLFTKAFNNQPLSKEEQEQLEQMDVEAILTLIEQNPESNFHKNIHETNTVEAIRELEKQGTDTQNPSFHTCPFSLDKKEPSATFKGCFSNDTTAQFNFTAATEELKSLFADLNNPIESAENGKLREGVDQAKEQLEKIATERKRIVTKNKLKVLKSTLQKELKQSSTQAERLKVDILKKAEKISTLKWYRERQELLGSAQLF